MIATVAAFFMSPADSAGLAHAAELEPQVFESQVARGSDDAYHTPAGWPSYSSTAVQVYAGSPGDNGPVYGGFRWSGLNIPAGAVITGAYVELSQFGWGHEIPTTLAFHDSAAPGTFSGGDSPYNRWAARTQFESQWQADLSSPGTWISTPDLAAGVQELVDRFGGISALVLLESGEGGQQAQYHEWSAFENGPAQAAKLHITYLSPAEPPPGGPGSLVAQVSSGTDDAYHSPVAWPNYSDSDVLVYAGAPGSDGAVYGGWRWSGLAIPEDAVIVSAYVELTQSGWGFETATTLAFEDAAAPGTFSPGSTPYDRWQGRTSFQAGWAWDRGAPGSTATTPDLAAGIQELVDRYGGIDSLALLESGEGVPVNEYHEWVSFEGAPAQAAKLHVVWTAPEPQPIEWEGVGQVLFVGPSQNPLAPTTASAQFSLGSEGQVEQVVVTTQNEFVAGTLIGPEFTSAVTSCEDSNGGLSCAELAQLLTGAMVSSLHTSVATLDNIVESTIQVPVPTEAGEIVLSVPTVSGTLTGQLNGVFVISTDTGAAVGTASLTFQPGSFGSYACFAVTELGPVPLESLEPCMDGSGVGQFMPFALSVTDTGTFQVGSGSGSLAAITSLEGDVTVTAQANLLLLQFGGVIAITNGEAELS